LHQSIRRILGITGYQRQGSIRVQGRCCVHRFKGIIFLSDDEDNILASTAKKELEKIRFDAKQLLALVSERRVALLRKRMGVSKDVDTTDDDVVQPSSTRSQRQETSENNMTVEEAQSSTEIFSSTPNIFTTDHQQQPSLTHNHPLLSTTFGGGEEISPRPIEGTKSLTNNLPSLLPSPVREQRTPREGEQESEFLPLPYSSTTPTNPKEV